MDRAPDVRALDAVVVYGIACAAHPATLCRRRIARRRKRFVAAHRCVPARGLHDVAALRDVAANAVGRGRERCHLILNMRRNCTRRGSHAVPVGGERVECALEHLLSGIARAQHLTALRRGVVERRRGVARHALRRRVGGALPLQLGADGTKCHAVDAPRGAVGGSARSYARLCPVARSAVGADPVRGGRGGRGEKLKLPARTGNVGAHAVSIRRWCHSFIRFISAQAANHTCSTLITTHPRH